MDIKSTLVLEDKTSKILKGMIKTMNIVISTMQKMDRVSNTIGKDAFKSMRNEINASEIELMELERRMNNLSENPPPSPFSRWQTSLFSLYAGINVFRAAIGGISKIANVSDEFQAANARIGLINDGLQIQAQLQEKILKSANRVRASYTSTADLITKIGMTGAIKNNDDQIAFSEKVNKMLKIGGGTAQMNDSALLQLSQSLASGVMQGDEFRSLKENAPFLMNSLAKGLGVSQAGLKKLATEGLLTTEKIIRAFDNMGGEIDEKFSSLPRTFGENVQVLKNIWGTFLQKLNSSNGILGFLNERFTKLTNFLSSESGTKLLDNIAMGLNFIAFLITPIFDMIDTGISMINEFGGVFEGVFGGVVAGAIMMIIPLLWQQVAALWQAVPPLFAQAASWIMCHAPILLIASAIGVVIGVLAHFGISASQVVGFVAGLFVGLVANIINKGLFFYNMVGQLATFLQNIFIDPVFAIKNLFYGMITNVLGFFDKLVNSIIDGLNFIIRAAQSVGANVKELEHKEFVKDFKMKNSFPKSNKNVKTWENKYLDPSELAGKANNFAMDKMNSLMTKLGNISLNKGFSSGGASGTIEEALGSGKDIGDIGKVGKVGSIEKDVNIANEDIKMLYDMAVGNRVNQINLYVETKQPQIINNNNISKDVDADKLIESIAINLDMERQITVEEVN